MTPALEGSFGEFQWVELPSDLYDIRTVVRHLAPELTGLTAVNVSWDSGHMDPTLIPELTGWRSVEELAVSPPLDATLTSNWPVNSCCDGAFDEWYFFRSVDGPLTLRAFCNWAGASLADARELNYPGGFDIIGQLERYRPDIVIGEGRDQVFVISLRREVIDAAISGCDYS